VGLWDTHCHLTFSPLRDALDDVLARAHAAGVTSIVVPAYDLASFGAVASLSSRPNVRTAFGVHPWASCGETSAAQLEAALDFGRAAAVGEIGLDFKIDGADRARQCALLEMQLDVAVARNLPVLLHCRGAFEELFEILKNRRGRVRGVVHAFTRGPELAMRFVGLGMHIAFGGAVTRPSAERARKSAAAVPADRLLLETDAPSIGLHGVLPEATEPRHVREVARALAIIRCVDEAEIEEITSSNARFLFD